jgi:hypothetical protein
MNWHELVAERKEWVDKNFPPDVYEHSLLGMIEEMGEFTHHYLKMEQDIRGSREEHLDEMKDAIGDITIYMWGVMYHKDIYPRTGYRAAMAGGIPEDITPRDLIFRLNYQIALLPHLVSRGKIEYICGLLSMLTDFWWGGGYEQIVQETWNQVKQRDWTVNKQDGGTSDIEDALVPPEHFDL